MDDSQGADEAEIRAACRAGDFRRAADRTLRAYGADLLGYLTVRLGDEALAREAYSDFSLDLWRGLERFEWRCPVRAWAYALARNAGHRAWTRRARTRGRERSWGPAHDVAASAASRTPGFMRTTMKSRVRALRERLSPEERELLVLRIDKHLTWPELATVVAGRELADDDVKREAARLRKRFQLTKERLRELAKREGLLDSPSEPEP
ncbi:MAG: sigma factor [Myxococcota bacterium]